MAMGAALLLVGIGFLVLTLRVLKREPARVKAPAMRAAPVAG
jgi:hypothetical protein